MMWLLAQDAVQQVKEGYSGLIISGLIILAMIIAGIWWLKRQS